MSDTAFRILVGVMCAVVLGVLLFGTARAESVTVSWVPPPGCEGDTDTTLSNCRLLGYRLDLFDGASWTPLATTPADTLIYVHQVAAPGLYVYRVVALASAGESAPSRMAAKHVVGDTFVTVAPEAYSVKSDAAKLGFYLNDIIGTVALNTPCLRYPTADPLPAKALVGVRYRRIDKNRVTWAGTARTVIPVALCGPKF